MRRRSWNPGDILLFFSDGVTEAVNADGEEYVEQRLQTVFKAHVHEPVETIKKALLDDLAVFTGETDQMDDITFVVLRL